MPSILTRPAGGGGAGGGSVSVAVSDASPSIGDTITITATNTGFTGTVTNTFIVKNFLGKDDVITQVGDNTYDYVCPFEGTFDIIVLAEDGSGNTAKGDKSITVGSFYDKYGFDAAWNAANAVLVSGRIDEVPDAINSYDAVAPSVSERCTTTSDPYTGISGMRATGNISSETLHTSYPHNTSSFTISVVSQFDYTEQTSFAGFMFIVGNTDTNVNNRRYTIVYNRASERIECVVFEPSGTSVTLSNAYQQGTNIIIFKYDSSDGSVRAIINGNTLTDNAPTLITGAGNVELLNTSFTTELGCGESVNEVCVVDRAVSDAEQDQMYQDLLLRFPS